MLVSLGLDFRRAGLEIRERFHLADDDVARARRALASSGALESVWTRTCNRIEATCWWPAATDVRPADRAHRIARAWVGGADPEAQLLQAHARVRHADEVARHLFRVAAGLESQVLGDVHILGQLRRAFREAVESRSIGSHLHRLFETALRVGKRVQRETPLATSRSSVGAEAARVAAARAGGLADRTCVVVGCGKSGAHAARLLGELGATDVIVLNRTVERARKLAQELGGTRAAGLDALPGALARADVVLVATAAREPVISAAAVRQARQGVERPLWIVDVSVPRNVESGAGEVPRVELIDLDTLHPEGAEPAHAHREAVTTAEALVEEEVEDFVGWLDLHRAGRMLHPLRAALSEICRREIAFLAGDSPLAERTADRIVSRLMSHPMSALRSAPRRDELVREAADALRTLFAAPSHPQIDPAALRAARLEERGDGDSIRECMTEVISLRRNAEWPS